MQFLSWCDFEDWLSSAGIILPPTKWLVGFEIKTEMLSAFLSANAVSYCNCMVALCVLNFFLPWPYIYLVSKFLDALPTELSPPHLADLLTSLLTDGTKYLKHSLADI